MRDYDIKSDLKQEQFQTLKLVQGDKGNKIKINVFEEGQPVDLAGCSITAKYKRQDGIKVNGTVTNISNNAFDAVMNNDITKVPGELKMAFTIEKDNVKVSTFILIADVKEGIGESTGSSSGSTGGSTGEVTEVAVDLSNYYKKSETYSKTQIDAQIKKNNYIHPNTHPATMITTDSTHRFVTDQEKTNWNNAISGTVDTVARESIDALVSGKIDNVELINNMLKFYANNQVKKTVTLPTTSGSGGGSSSVAGLPTGGSTGQILAKSSNANYDVQWKNETTYTHPNTHPASMISTDSTHRFVTDAQITKWNNNSSSSGGSSSSSTGGNCKASRNYITPQMYGAVGDGTTDDYEAFQAMASLDDHDQRYIIDLGGLTYYVSKTIKLTTRNKTFMNGKIIGETHTFTNELDTCSGHNFLNLDVVSNNGYCFYIKSITENQWASEWYYITYINVKMKGKLGGYYSKDIKIGFSQLFLNVLVTSTDGDGFYGVKGPGTVMVHCVNEGLLNGALFANCFCPIIASDSNGQMKYGVKNEGYFNFTVQEFNGCNFEHCLEQGVYAPAGGMRFKFINSSFTKVENQEKNANLRKQTEAIYIKGQAEIEWINTDISKFNYTNSDDYVDFVFEGSPNWKVSTNSNNNKIFKARNAKFYRNPVMTLPKVFEGVLKLNEYSADNSTVPNIEMYDNGQIHTDNSSNFMRMYYRKDNAKVSLDSNGLILLESDGYFANSYAVKDTSIRSINGVKSLFKDKMGDGTPICIRNSTTNTVTLKHNTGSGMKFIFKNQADKTLAADASVLFIVKDNNLYELF